MNILFPWIFAVSLDFRCICLFIDACIYAFEGIKNERFPGYSYGQNPSDHDVFLRRAVTAADKKTPLLPTVLKDSRQL